MWSGTNNVRKNRRRWRLKKLLLFFIITILGYPDAKEVYEDFYKLETNLTASKGLYDKWINIPNTKSKDSIEKDSYPEVIRYLESRYTSSYFIGVIELEKVKVSKSTSSCADAIYEAKINKSYKHIKSKYIKFHHIMCEDFYLMRRQKYLVILDKHNGSLWIDSWSSLPPEKEFLEFLDSCKKQTKIKSKHGTK